MFKSYSAALLALGFLSSAVLAAPAPAASPAATPAPTAPAASVKPGPVAPLTAPYAVTSNYHNIRVMDEGDEGQMVRTLYFDDTMESRMSVNDPTTGQFEYTEYFQMVWLWNQNIKKVLILGLGGSSTQRAFEYYYPDVTVETAEIDSVVADIAQKYFTLKVSDRQKLNVLDGRYFLRRSTDKYDAILLDAYTQGRYGASIPPQLVTKEFFQLVHDHLTPDGVLAYNVITTLRDYNTDIVPAMYRTMKEVFPQVYYFPAESSLNYVFIASQSKTPMDLPALRKTANALVESKKVTIPNFLYRVERFVDTPPANYLKAPILTDDFAPVEGLTGAAPGMQKPSPSVTPAAPKN